MALTAEEAEGLRRYELQQRALGVGRERFTPRAVAPANGAAVVPGPATVGPKGVIQTLGLQVQVVFRESLKQVPDEVLGKMYDELMAELNKRGVRR